MTNTATITTHSARKPASRELVKVDGELTRVGSTSDWRGLIATFVSSQDVKQSSRNLYARTLTQFFKWLCEAGRSINDIDRVGILEYKDSLSECGLSSLTVSSYITAVRKFFEWSEANRLYPNVAKGIKTPKRKQAFKKQHLSDDKSRELLNHFEAVSKRDFAIANLMLRCGLRTIEVVRANIEDITFRGERRILKVWGKGREMDCEEEDFVVLSYKVYQPIADYLATRKGAKGGEPLFASNSRQNKGERLTTRTISGICKEGMKAIGLDGKEFTAHSLRHTTAVAMISHGASLPDVQGVLRHTSPVTTQIYLESAKEELRLKNAPELMLDNAF